MAGRYLVTGVQLGMLKVIPLEEKNELINSIIDNQFIGNSKEPIDEDVKTFTTSLSLLTIKRRSL
jgi:hypothetical protein